MIGETVGNYRIISPLGEGGMGVVYLAEHTLMGRKAAVKVLRPEYSSNPAVLDRFFNEARAVALIKHPGLIDIFDYGHHASGAAYITMEFLDGESLAARLERVDVIDPSLAVDITRQAALVLAAAHEQEIVHRDFKPDNVFLLPSRELPSGVRVKVLDFGIAKLGGDSAFGQRTRTGALLGTPTYMSPEQCRAAKEVDRRSDLYSLGCVLFEMITGDPPFTGEGPGEVMAAHMRDPVPDLAGLRPDLPADLVTLVGGCLAKRPEERPQTMEDVVLVLDSLAMPPVTDPGFPPGMVPSTGVRPVAQARSSSPSNPQPAPSPTGRHRSTPEAPTIAAVETRPTTLGQTAGEAMPEQVARGGSRLGILVALVLLVVIGGGAGLFLLRGRSGNPPTTAPATVAAPTAPKAAPAKPSTVRLKIESDPSGAEVVRAADQVVVGQTPFVKEILRAQGEAIFVVRLAGFEDGKVSLDTGEGGTAKVALRPVAPPPTAKAASPAGKRPAGTRPAKSKKGEGESGELGLFDE